MGWCLGMSWLLSSMTSGFIFLYMLQSPWRRPLQFSTLCWMIFISFLVCAGNVFYFWGVGFEIGVRPWLKSWLGLCVCPFRTGLPVAADSVGCLLGWYFLLQVSACCVWCLSVPVTSISWKLPGLTEFVR